MLHMSVFCLATVFLVFSVKHLAVFELKTGGLVLVCIPLDALSLTVVPAYWLCGCNAPGFLWRYINHFLA